MTKIARFRESTCDLLEDLLTALHPDFGTQLPGHFGNGVIVIECLGLEQKPRRATSGTRAKC
jgi:hypothetical protein